MKCTIAIAATLAALAAFAQGPTVKQILDVDAKMLEIESINTPDDAGITRAYAESCLRSKINHSDSKTEHAMQKEIFRFVVDYQKMPVNASLIRMQAKIESDKSLRNVIASSDNVLRACCETIAAGVEGCWFDPSQSHHFWGFL